MLNRIITSLVAVGLLVFVLLSDAAVVNAAVFICILILLYELYRAEGVTKKPVLFLIGMAAPFFVFLTGKVSVPLLICGYIFLLFLVLVFFHKNIKFADAAKVFFLSIFVTAFLWHIALLRALDNGVYLTWTVFIGACMSDTTAYFVGRFLGKHKLAPEISPKKTIEGSIGGLSGAAIGFLVYGLILSKCFSLQPDIIRMILLGLVASAAAQIGDLSASIIKRECQIKDFGHVLPGHGGVLDRFDSILFVAPVIYYFVTFFPIFK